MLISQQLYLQPVTIFSSHTIAISTENREENSNLIQFRVFYCEILFIQFPQNMFHLLKRERSSTERKF